MSHDMPVGEPRALMKILKVGSTVFASKPMNDQHVFQLKNPHN